MPTIRVMTLNNFNTIPEAEVEYFSDLWANRAAFNVKTLKRYDPDLIGFQEFEPEHWAAYRRELTGYAHALTNESGEGTAILWKSERFVLLDQGALWLPRSELAHLSDLEDDILMCTSWVKLRCQQNGLEFIYLNTHLNDVSEGARQAGNALNLQQLTALDGNGALPVIMSGDFNCNPWSPVYRQLLGAGFVDAYRAAGHADSVESSTFHGFHGSAYFALEWGDQVFWRVDWIMVRSGQRQLQTTSCTIVRDAEPPVYVSDHYPVVAEVLAL
jgi:endonuclease/exonuclease/phosphatase family metal-dependent hydrolase